MPRNSSAANPHEEVFLMIVFQSHFGHPSVDTAIGSCAAGFEEPITEPDIVHAAVRKRSRRVIFKSYLKLKVVTGSTNPQPHLVPNQRSHRPDLCHPHKYAAFPAPARSVRFARHSVAGSKYST